MVEKQSDLKFCNAIVACMLCNSQGLKTEARYYALNILEELDETNEVSFAVFCLYGHM